MPEMRRIDIKEDWLRKLILDKARGNHYVQNYAITQEQILEYVDTLVERGLEWYFGCPEEGFVYRVAQVNPYVIEPHYLGCMKKLRTLQPLALEWVFADTQTQKINVYTRLKASVRIQQRFGYKVEGIITNSFLEDGRLHDLYVLGLSREDYYAWCSQKKNPTHLGAL